MSFSPPAVDPLTAPTTAADAVPARSSVSPGQRGAPGTGIGGRYTLRTAIGHGGMGTVWRATDTLLRRDVAVKEVLLPQGMAASDRDALYQRTLREARAAAALQHPSVVQVYDVVTEGGRPWIVMELLNARSLAEMIVEDGPLAPRAVAKIGIALLGALEVAHAASVLHRDVKPANVLICADGRCVLTDFGVARMPTDSQLTTPGMVLGSPHFISPERAIGAPFGPPSDLFSLGVTLYTAVEGRPPFDRPDPFETMRAVVEEPPAPALRAGALSGVLYGLLEKDPGRRWDVQTARGVLRDLLSAALASNAPAHVTDPYAVVRQAAYRPPAIEAKPTGQIGGRAMIGPGETVSGAIRRLRSGGAPVPSQREPVESKAGPGYHGSAGTDTGALPQAGDVPDGRGGRRSHRAASGAGGTYRAQSGAGHRGALGRLAGVPPARLALAAGGVLIVLLLGVVIGTKVFTGSNAPVKPVVQASPSVDQPLLPVQEYRDRGVRVNVPAGWRQSLPKSGTFVDYIAPDGTDRWVRINIEKANGATGRAVLEAAAKRFQNGSGCPHFEQIDLRDASLDDRAGAVLEYTCSPDAAPQRHGLWQVVVVDGKAYQVTLSVPNVRFDESRAVFDEMVRSFKFEA